MPQNRRHFSVCKYGRSEAFLNSIMSTAECVQNMSVSNRHGLFWPAPLQPNTTLSLSTPIVPGEVAHAVVWALRNSPKRPYDSAVLPCASLRRRVFCVRDIASHRTEARHATGLSWAKLIWRWHSAAEPEFPRILRGGDINTPKLLSYLLKPNWASTHHTSAPQQERPQPYTDFRLCGNETPGRWTSWQETYKSWLTEPVGWYLIGCKGKKRNSINMYIFFIFAHNCQPKHLNSYNS